MRLRGQRTPARQQRTAYSCTACVCTTGWTSAAASELVFVPINLCCESVQNVNNERKRVRHGGDRVIPLGVGGTSTLIEANKVNVEWGKINAWMTDESNGQVVVRDELARACVDPSDNRRPKPYPPQPLPARFHPALTGNSPSSSSFQPSASLASPPFCVLASSPLLECTSPPLQHALCKPRHSIHLCFTTSKLALSFKTFKFHHSSLVLVSSRSPPSVANTSTAAFVGSNPFFISPRLSTCKPRILSPSLVLDDSHCPVHLASYAT